MNHNNHYCSNVFCQIDKRVCSLYYRGGEIVIDITYYGIKGVLSKNPTILSIRNALQR